jgi:hypothetical protein
MKRVHRHATNVLALAAAFAAAGAQTPGSASSIVTPARTGTTSAATSGLLTASPSATVFDGRAHIHLTVPGPGRLSLKIVHHDRPIGRRTVTTRGRGARAIGVPLTHAALHELHEGNFSAGLRVTFAGADGTRLSRSFGLRLRRAST